MILYCIVAKLLFLILFLAAIVPALLAIALKPATPSPSWVRLNPQAAPVLARQEWPSAARRCEGGAC